MPNRLEIELTSARGDGSYTWRAAGARQPKGVVDAKTVGDGAKVGDVLRVEAEFEIDGITILSVLPPKEKAAPSGRIELLGSSKPVPAVTTVLVSEGGRGRGGERRDLLDSPRRADRSPSRERRPPRAGEREEAPSRERSRSTRPPDAEPRGERSPRPEGAPAASAARGVQRGPETPGGGRRPGAAATPGRTRTPGGELARTGARRASSRPGQAEAPARRAAPRFEPGTANRDALIAALAPEQRPIVERLAAGGIPAVRRAVAEDRERARSEGRPETSGDAILALAEQLAPSVKQATWLDRAEAAIAQLDRISLRDLRATVVAAMPRDEKARELDRKLREELDRRVAKLRSNWQEQMTHALEEGRVLQALRLSAQPPEPTARFPAALVERLATSAGAAMTASTPTERWLAILDAAVASPIRRQIHPAGLAEDLSGEVVRRARLAAGSIPALAPLLGLPMPPPPKPLRTARPPRPPRPATSGRRQKAASVGAAPAPSEPLIAEAPEPGASAPAPSEPLIAEAPEPGVTEPAAASDTPEPAGSQGTPEPAALPEAPAEAALPPPAPEDALPPPAPEDALPPPAPEDALPENPPSSG